MEVRYFMTKSVKKVVCVPMIVELDKGLVTIAISTIVSFIFTEFYLDWPLP